MSSFSDQVPPHDFDAEKAVLAACLLNPSAIDESTRFLAADDFYREQHSIIFDCIADLRDGGVPVDVLSVANHLDTYGMLEKAGGKPYLLEVLNTHGNSSHATTYARIVKERSKARKLVGLGARMMAEGYKVPENLDEVIGECASSLSVLSMDGTEEAKSSAHIMHQFISDLHHAPKAFINPPHLPWVRMAAGDLVVVSAGTGVGKTATVLDWADEWSKTIPTVYFEYEMTEADLMMRLVCKNARLTWEQLQDRSLTPQDLDNVESVVKDLSTRHLRIQEVWCGVSTLAAKIRKEVQRGARIVVVDHLGLIPITVPKGMNHAKAVGTEVTGRLKRLASELGITIVLLCQLSREGQKDGHFPRLHHLRDSGEIEQDASIVVMLWSDRSLAEDEAKRVAIRDKSGILSGPEMVDGSFDLVRLGVEKNRNGRPGEKYLLYHGEHFRYEDRNEVLPLVNLTPQMFGGD